MKNALLLTKNATIKKLFSLSLEKKGIELKDDNEEISFNDVDVIFVDNEYLNEELLEKLQNCTTTKILILGKNDEKLPGWDEYMNKPFLPTDLITLLDKLEQQPVETIKDEDISNSKEDDFDFDNDDFSFDDDLEDEKLNDDLDVDDDLDLDDDFLDDDLDLDTLDNMDDVSETNNNLDDIDTDLDLDDDLDLDNIEAKQEDTPKDETDDIPKEGIDLDEDEDKEEEFDIEDPTLDIDNLDEPEEVEETEETIDENDLDMDNLDELNETTDEQHKDDNNFNDIDNTIEEISNNENIKEPTEEITKETSNEESEELEMIDENFENELAQINEQEMADILGEEIEEIENDEIDTNENLDSTPEIEENILAEEPYEEEQTQSTTQINTQPKQNIEKEHTLNNLLNLNIEALKNSGATITITIKFDKE